MDDSRANQNLQTVKTVGTEAEAAVVVGFLQANGLDAGAESLHASEFPTEVGQLSEVRIEVPAEQAADALRLLADSESALAGGSDFPPPSLVEE
jgi:cysteine synthase